MSAARLTLPKAKTREAELVVCCATSRATPERTARLRAMLAKGVDWQCVARMASAHSVMPLVYRYCRAELGEGQPGEAMRGAFYGNSVRNVHLARELLSLIALLERGGIEPLAIKGPALAIEAYGDLAMRQFSDLDLLVRSRETARALEILRDAGYTPHAGYAAAELERPDAYEVALGRAGALGDVDLHWRLMPAYFPLAIDGEDLWQRAVRVEIQGVGAPTLAPADHLLYLCAHGAKHGWQTLGGICDLAELARAPHSGEQDRCAPAGAIDWDALRARAERAGAGRALALGMLLAHELLDAAAPPALLDAARRTPAVVRAARSFAGYLSDAGGEGPGFRQRWIVPLGVIETPRGRLRYAFARALLPSADDRRFVRLPRLLHPLYYVVRPLRVGLREAPAALRRLVRATLLRATPRRADQA